MSELRDWLNSQPLTEKRITVKGREFLVMEANLAERSRTLAAHAKNGHLANEDAEALLMCLCVLDPVTGERVVEPADYNVWQKQGVSFAPLLRAVLDVNGFSDDEVEAEVKNSDTTQV